MNGNFWSKRSACTVGGCWHKRIGPSGVHAQAVAAGINVVAIVLGIIFLSFFLSLLRLLLFYQKEGS